ncbi:MAG: ShlB/FhaC/HecB family hemolysin secretion/activation protein [Proteobacteria bacterium]|nr:ShlB/FhaC/HecB family hemolysin secretion/activation protein [Pseudomonadota bacterium]
MQFNKTGFLALLLTTVLVPANAHAQSAQQRLPGVIDRGTPDLEVPKSHDLNTPMRDPLKEEPTIQNARDNQVVANVSKINFDGPSSVSQSDLQAIAASYVNRPLTKADVAKLKFEVTKLYYDKGYILVKITTPPQNLADKTLDVKIYEAKIGDIKVNNEDVLNPFLTRQVAGQVEKGDVFNEVSVESMVSDLDSLKGVQANLGLRPGSAFGTTDLVLNMKPIDEDENYVQVDNYGAELTGTNIATIHLEKSNLLHWGESVNATLRRSNEDLVSVNAGLRTPIGFRNFMFEIDGTNSKNEIGDRLAALDASGTTRAVNVAIADDVLNTRTQKSTLRVGLDSRTHESKAVTGPTDDEIRQGYVSGSYLRRMTDGVAYASAKLGRGVDGLGASEDGSTKVSRIQGHQDAWKFEPVIIAQYRPIQDGTIKFLGTGQLSSDALLSSDLFALGGYGSVRGFEPAQETGDAGYQFSLEYNQDFDLTDGWTLRTGPFVDGGAVYNRLPGASVDNHLYSVGIGAEVAARLFGGNAAETKLRADWALPVGDYTSNQVDASTIYVRLTQGF